MKSCTACLFAGTDKWHCVPGMLGTLLVWPLVGKLPLMKLKPSLRTMRGMYIFLKSTEG